MKIHEQKWPVAGLLAQRREVTADRTRFRLRECLPVAVDIYAAKIAAPLTMLNTVRIHQRHYHGLKILAKTFRESRAPSQRIHKTHQSDGTGDLRRMLAADDKDVVLVSGLRH